jgi:hypothetical protein
MANTRIELDLTKFVSVRIAQATAHAIKANELFISAKALLDSAGTTADQMPLTGLTEAKAGELYTVIVNAVANSNTLRTEMRKIDQGVET